MNKHGIPGLMIVVGDEKDTDESEVAYKDASETILEAIKKKDAKLLSTSLKDFITLCLEDTDSDY